MARKGRGAWRALSVALASLCLSSASSSSSPALHPPCPPPTPVALDDVDDGTATHYHPLPALLRDARLVQHGSWLSGFSCSKKVGRLRLRCLDAP